MSKPHKIKKYADKTSFYPAKKRFRKLRLFVGLLLVVALIFVGISIYNPISNYLSGKISPSPLPEPPVVITPEQSNPSPEPLPENETTPEPQPISENIRAFELPVDVAKDSDLLDKYISELPDEINHLVLNLKDNNGRIYYNSKVEPAVKWGAVVDEPIDINAVVQKLNMHSIKLTARISVLSDPVAARGDLENNAVMHSSGVIWIDNVLANGGKPWTTPYSQAVKDYNIAIAKELVEIGAEAIVLDYLYFPNDPTNSANFKSVEGVSKLDVLGTFYSDLKSSLGEIPVFCSITLDSATHNNTGTNLAFYGGDPLAMGIDSWLISIDNKPFDSDEIKTTLFNEANKDFRFMLETNQNDNPALLENQEIDFVFARLAV